MKYILATLSLIMIYNTCMGQTTTRIYKNEYFDNSSGNGNDVYGLYSGKGVFLDNGDFVIGNQWNPVKGSSTLVPTITCLGEDGEINWSYRMTEMELALDGLSVTNNNEIIIPTSLSKVNSLINEYAYIFKLDGNGNMKWSKGIKGYNFVKTIVTGDGNIVALCRELYQQGSTLIKFTPAGKLLWAYSFEQFYVNEISETGDELLMTGSFYDKENGINYWGIVWLDQGGTKTDSRKFFMGTGKSLALKSVKVDKDGYTVAGGVLSIGGTPYIQDYGLLVKFNKDRSILWLKKYESGPRKIGFENMINRNGNWLLNGWFYKDDKVASGFVVESDKDGNISRASGLKIDTAGIALLRSGVNPSGQIYYSGILVRTLPPKEFAYTMDDLIVFQTEAGWIECFEHTLPMTVSDFTAYTYTDVDIMQDTVTTLKFLDLKVGIEPDDYITGYTICETTATTEVSAEAGALRLYPNPVSTTLSIDVEQAGYGTVREQTVDITDLLGRKLYEVEVGYDGHAEVDTKTLPPGMYIAVLRADMHQVQAVKFVVGR
ncbi:MAG TPA: T9SS type A sorting domain-containing protein [Saprospiraceae bacterium]|nr:T9SS type A sorting domain-containing protein [Saprospiraceae bacterium]